jgi:GT2 family glycosyltransferase
MNIAHKPAALPPFSLDIVIVAFHPKHGEIERLLQSVCEQSAHPFTINVAVFDNSADTVVTARVRDIVGGFGAHLVMAPLVVSPTNVGFGCGVNALLQRTSSDFVLTINQDAYLAVDALAVLGERIPASAPDIAAWELRQVPYEHPKDYNPVTQETMWLSGAACLFRRTALTEVKGFEPLIFMYGEDVDLSWRLRRKNWRILYVPRAVCAHSSYAYAHEIKPVQFAGSIVANLYLRARFGSLRDVAIGLAMLAHEWTVPEEFPGRKRMLFAAFTKFLSRAREFRRGGWRENASVPLPHFNLWDYGSRREGDFYAFPPPDAVEPAPLVSILIRTHRRPWWLREALSSVMNQTYANLEVIVVEDGAAGEARSICNDTTWRFPVHYSATGEPVGRSRAGNIAMASAHGQWFNFLDDDDVLFADHVEVLVREALRAKASVVYSFAWEVPTTLVSTEPLVYEEALPLARYRELFSRFALWHHDFLPIQAVLFNRSVFAEVGGFAEDMDQLEDWNLWTRMAAKHDFAMVDKTTSKYRVPANAAAAGQRQDALDRAYADAVARQADIHMDVTPETFKLWPKVHEAHLARQQHLANVKYAEDAWRRRWFVRWPYKVAQRLRGREKV